MSAVCDFRYDAPVDHLLFHCGNLQSGERVAILCDEQTESIAAYFRDRALRITTHAVVLNIPAAVMHATEPDPSAAAALLEQDLIIGLTYSSLAHTRARQAACARGGRYLSLPEYSWSLLRDPSVMADFRARAPIVRRVADAFSAGSFVRVTTKAGTDIRLDVRNRSGNYCPGFVEGPGVLGSPPDIEANVSPVETGSEGIIVVDGSIPCRGIGLLKTPVSLHVSKGRVTRFSGSDHNVIENLETIFAAVGSDKAYVLAECGIGLNELAALTGVMLTDEGTNGSVHFGIGSNATVGGLNDVAFHLDFVCREASIEIDGRVLIDNGKLVDG